MHARFSLRSLLFAALLLLPCLAAFLTRVSAQEPPGTREFYEGLASSFPAGTVDPDLNASARRPGNARLEVTDGVLSGQFLFDDGAGSVLTATCRGHVDPVNGRGFLKLQRGNPAAAEPLKVPVLLRQGVLTGGTMTENGEVLAFRLELYLILAPP